MNIKMDEDLFDGIAQGISKIYHEVFLLMKFLQTKSEVKYMNFFVLSYFIPLLKKEMKKEL